VVALVRDPRYVSWIDPILWKGGLLVKGRRGDARNSADGAVRLLLRRRISQRARRSRRRKEMVPMTPPTIPPTSVPFAALPPRGGLEPPVPVPETVAAPSVGSEP